MHCIYTQKRWQAKQRRSILRCVVLVLFLVLFANTANAQSLTVSLMPSGNFWQNTTATVYEGETVQFIVQLSRALTGSESVTVQLNMSAAFSDERTMSDPVTRLVNAPAVSLTNSSGRSPNLTFTGGSRTARLALELVNPARGASGIDSFATITFESITGAVANTMQNTLNFKILIDEFFVCFSEDNYNIREGDNTQMILQIERGGNADKTIGLRQDITVTFTYNFGIEPSIFGLPSSEDQYEPFGNVTIPAGQPNIPLSDPISDDSIIEIPPPELPIILTIESNSTNADGSCRSNIFILDNDPTVSIAAGSDVTAGSTATFTVTRNAPQTSALAVTLNVSESSDDNKNYVASTNEGRVTVSIPANQAMFVHPIPTISDDTTGSSNSILAVEVVSMSGSVSSTSGYYLGEPNSADLSIMQPRPPGIFIRGKVFLEGPLQ